MKGHVKSLVFPDEPGFPPFWNSVSPTSCLFFFFFMATQSTAGVSLDEPIFAHFVLHYFCYHTPKKHSNSQEDLTLGFMGPDCHLKKNAFVCLMASKVEVTYWESHKRGSSVFTRSHVYNVWLISWLKSILESRKESSEIWKLCKI